jgi:hypothetical protein
LIREHGRPYRGEASIPLPLDETSWSEQRLARPLLTADEVRRLARDEAIVVVSNQRPIWTKRWWWNREAREAAAATLGCARVAALDSPRPAGPRTPPRPTPRDLKARLEQLDDDDELEDLPNDVGRDRR